MTSRIINRLHPFNSAFFICDMQEKFRNNIKYFSQITAVTRRLFDAAIALDMQILATEQYPQGLGQTVKELPLINNNIKIFNKTKFSMCLPELLNEINKDVKSIILCGIEAHVCILQTTFDLLEKGYDVHVVADATSSRSLVDRFFAYKQLERAGATLTTSECVLLGLLEDSAHPKFSEIRKLIIESAPDTGLTNFF